MKARIGVVAALTTALAAAAGFSSAAQDSPRPQVPEFRSGVELVTVDVGVVDKQGQPLRGLGPDDFIVTVAGQPRRVVSAEFVDASPAKAGSPSKDVVPVSTNQGGGIGRLVVFVVDQSTLDPGGARRVASAASRFLSQLTFSDRSALMLLPVGQGVQFTWAHDRVRQALERVTGFGRPASSWELGSLAEARDIANRSLVALRMVGERECQGGAFADADLGSAFGGGGGNAAPTQGPPPSSGGGAPAGGESGSGGAAGGGGTAQPSGGGTATGSASRGSRGATGSLGNSCMRDLQMRAESAWRTTQMTSLGSIAALRQLLSSLARVRGDKTIILISGGWPLDDREEVTLLSTVASDAAAARATVFTLFVPVTNFSADRRSMSTNPTADRDIHLMPLETLAAMTGGGSYRIDVGAESTFDRLSRELGGYYRIGVEKNATDLDGKGRTMKVRVARGGLTVRARDLFDVRTYEDRDWAARLASALDAPVPATSVGLRLTSYLATSQDDARRVKLVLVGEASRMRPGDATLQLIVNDLDGKKIFGGEQSLGDVTTDALPFSTNFAVPPGSYIIRLAIMDGEGRVGSVDHRVDVRPVAVGNLTATGPLLVRVPAAGNAEPHFALDAVRQDERLALEVDLEGDKDRLAATDVGFEIATAADGPALVQAVASLARGPRDGSALAQAVADMRLLPPGDYVVRAKIKSGDQVLGEVRRAFAVVETARPVAESIGTTGTSATMPGARPTLPRAPYAVMPRFTLEQVLAPTVLDGFLDRVAERPDAASAPMRDLLERARTAKLADLAVPDGGADGAAVAAFVRGLTLLAQNQLDPAANAFRSAMRASPDFYPAMVYLGACYAAGGNDKEAAGAWRTALIRESDVAPLHVWLTDALIRQGRADQALETLDEARARWPDDSALKRRFVIAALLAGRYTDGLDALDALIDSHADDEPSLAFGLLVLYESFMDHRPIESVENDRARMTRLAEAYRVRGGPALALVNTWVAAAHR